MRLLKRVSRGRRSLSGRVSLRAWVARFLQGRRRKRAAAPRVPLAPSNLTALDNSTYVQLSWTDRSADELGFRVYRKEGSGSYGLWQTLGANVVQVQDSGVIIYETYAYYVVAYNAVGESAQSNEAVVTAGPI